MTGFNASAEPYSLERATGRPGHSTYILARFP